MQTASESVRAPAVQTAVQTALDSERMSAVWMTSKAKGVSAVQTESEGMRVLAVLVAASEGFRKVGQTATVEERAELVKLAVRVAMVGTEEPWVHCTAVGQVVSSHQSKSFSLMNSSQQWQKLWKSY